jgi:hypothetical protein
VNAVKRRNSAAETPLFRVAFPFVDLSPQGGHLLGHYVNFPMEVEDFHVPKLIRDTHGKSARSETTVYTDSAVRWAFQEIHQSNY